MIKTRFQTGYFFQHKKCIEELAKGIQSDHLRVGCTLNKTHKEAQQYAKVDKKDSLISDSLKGIH